MAHGVGGGVAETTERQQCPVSIRSQRINDTSAGNGWRYPSTRKFCTNHHSASRGNLLT